jgi:excinuclease ABC subunit A
MNGSEPCIQIRGAREHNLKDISIDLPRNKLIVITGPSGSGKSTLAFDTIFAEGQRRYIESLSAYAKQFVDQLKKPDVESIRGLCPSIAIQQKGIAKNPRSTVGTLTEIYDFLRLLFSRVGDPFCPDCHVAIEKTSAPQIVDQIMALADGTKINVLGVLARKKKGEFTQELNQLVKLGLVRARIDGEDQSLTKDIRLEKNKPHDIFVYVDRLAVKSDSRGRIQEAVELASTFSKGLIQIELFEKGKTLSFNQSLSCPSCGKGFPEMTPRLFSFNSPIGACVFCNGLGYLQEKVGEGEEIEEDTSEAPVPVEICPSCEGTRLKNESRSVFINKTSISDLVSMSVLELKDFAFDLKLDGRKALLAEKVMKEIKDRLDFLCQVGLDYLSLDRRASTLSGGEEQRVILATQIGTKLTGVLYVLDEPSIGLHHADNQRLIDSLKKLRDLGNSVLVVEHDLDTMLAADLIVDLGPGAGRLGGSIVDFNTPKRLAHGATADFLNGTKIIPPPKTRRKISGDSIQFLSCSLHNLKNIDVKIPLGAFSVVTGVSGSGKSTLVLDVISESLLKRSPIGCRQVKGLESIDKIIRVDQSPIGRTSRSNPATYIGLFGTIRELFSQTPDSRKKGYTPSRFSFNVSGGRCEECKGAGELDVEMHFLADVSVPCESCGQRRFNSATLDITFKGRNIYDVLEMTFSDAFEFFEAVPALQNKFKVMIDVGLGYLKLGQPATTLSGGEAQRVKLARELSKRSTGKTLYILDEPTTGLHFVDIERLLQVVQQLVDLGNTVLMIEHQLDVIQAADFVIDLGPDGGKAGGKIMASGTPEAISKNLDSKTGQALTGLKIKSS